MFKLGPLIRKTALVMGVMSFGLVATAEAQAGGGRHKGGHHSYKKHHYSPHYRSHYRHHYRAYGRYHHYKPYYRGGHRSHFRGSFHGHGGGDVALGIIAGGLLVYGLTQAARSHDRTESRTVYVQQPVQNSGWVAAAPPQPAQPAGSCLQEREYQTTITVGNETVPAYGTACLQPDGSWKFGPAQSVPEYAR